MALGEIKRNRKKVAAARRREHERAAERRADAAARRKRGERVDALPHPARVRRVPITAAVYRTAGSGSKHNYSATACPGKAQRPISLRASMAGSRREGRSSRCGYGEGRTPTAAIKKALHRMATKLK